MKKTLLTVQDNMGYAIAQNKEFKRLGINNAKILYDTDSFFNHINTDEGIVLLDHKLGSQKCLNLMKEIELINNNVEVILLNEQEDIGYVVSTLKLNVNNTFQQESTVILQAKNYLNRYKRYRQIVKERKQTHTEMSVKSMAIRISVCMTLFV